MADKKIAIGLGVAAGAAALIYLATRAKAAEPEPPPPGLANLYGLVTDAETGELILGVSVSLWDPEETELLASTYTGTGGYYLIQNIYPGSYVVYFAKEGYETLMR